MPFLAITLLWLLNGRGIPKEELMALQAELTPALDPRDRPQAPVACRTDFSYCSLE